MLPSRSTPFISRFADGAVARREIGPTEMDLLYQGIIPLIWIGPRHATARQSMDFVPTTPVIRRFVSII